MNTTLIYRFILYVLLAVAATIVCGDSTDSRLDAILPHVVAGAGFLTFFILDQHPRLGLPRELANVLALGTLGLLYLESRAPDSQLIRCLAHWTIYLQLIKFARPKTAEDDWFLILLALTQVLIGSVINQSDLLGVWLLVWAMLAVWVLGLFFLQREASRFLLEASAAAAAQVQGDPDPYRGLFDLPYLAAVARTLLLTLLLGGFFFLLLPRQVGATRARGRAAMSRHLTGFDDEVKLGQLGEILESDNVVFAVEFTNLNRKPVTPGGEPLFRGVTLTQYENRSWKRPMRRSPQMIASLKPLRKSDILGRRLIRQVYKMEPNDSETLFALRPVVELSAANRLPPMLNPVDGTIFRPEPRGPYDYEVVSEANTDGVQDSEAIPSADRMKFLLGVSAGLRERLREITLPLVINLPSEGAEAVTARARALEAHLRDSGQFGYTLEMDVVDRSLDPVEDFLVNRKMGHCEYFASALALMLRSVGIPSRMVNGFKGGDWSELTQSMTVRQKHAHSWVEAYLGENDQGLPHWLVLDPTPGADRDVSVAQVGGVAGRFRPVTDMIRHVWVFYILGYDSDRQNRLLYSPIRTAIREVRESYSRIWSWTQWAFARLFRFQNLSSFISVRGFIVSFIVLCLVALIGKFLATLGSLVLRWWRGPGDDTAGLTAGILFYRRLAQMLAAFDLHRSPAETQNEFALRAARFLSGQGSLNQDAAEVPQKIVNAFYLVRFGHRELDHDTLKDLEEDLDSLQKQLSHP